MEKETDILGFDPSQLSIFGSDKCEHEKEKPVNIYLAGKIEPNGWRQLFFNMRNEFSDDELIPHLQDISITMPWDKNINVTGPFFLSCDHSCYHGEGNHGLGIHAPVCCLTGGTTHSASEVIDICKKQIERADIIFGYINDDTCYGTMFEIGWAKALGKKIILLFDTAKRENDMWFLSKNADYSISLDVYELKDTNPYLYKKITGHEYDWFAVSDIEELANKLIDRIYGRNKVQS